MIVEGKRKKLRLQPHERQRLNFINHLQNGALFAIKQPVISFFPYFSRSASGIPKNLQN